MKKLITLAIFVFTILFSFTIIAQQKLKKPPWPSMVKVMSHDPNFKITSQACFYKRKSEWQKIIDSTWGPGLPLAQKLSVFDYYSNFIKTYNATFTYTRLNWDSVSAHWRAKITDSTSRGGFSAILSALVRPLHDRHARVWDLVLSQTPLNPGTPILVDIPYDGEYLSGAVSHFGAELTPLPDSSLLVYKVVPNHPLGLEPGDIVLGYEGIPWRNLYRELIAAGIPTVQLNEGASSARAYGMLYCAGMNWHLFDTIDVVKYATGDTVHLPTDTLINLKPAGGLVNSAQLPVPGVPMPGWAIGSDGWPTSDGVSYGIVQGTDIGYIYVYHQANDNVGAMFNTAVTALAQTHGLIIDLRFDEGGWSGLNKGIARLTTYAGPTLEDLKRSSPTDLWSLTPVTGDDDFTIPQDNLSYQYPVAILVGPSSASYGDLSARQLTYVNNARFFGKSPSGAYSGWGFVATASATGFYMVCPDVTTVDKHSPDTQLWGTEFPVDEDVWLTSDGAANGKDDVVNAALSWMNNLVYGHDLTKNTGYCLPGTDTLKISALVENPNSHQTASKVYIKNLAGSFIDSLDLTKTGLIDSSETWTGNYLAPDSEDFFSISLSAKDIDESKTWTTDNISRFTTVGPLTVDSVQYKNDYSSGLFGIRVLVHNWNKTKIIKNASVKIIATDPWAFGQHGELKLPNISPDISVETSRQLYISYDNSNLPGYFNLKFEIKSDGWTYWTDSIRVQIPATGIAAQTNLPLTFKLEQNYPNPFNPSTTIKYSIPKQSYVTLRVYDILGREIETLVNEEKPAGNYEVEFHGQQTTNNKQLSSGIYFYQIKASDYVCTKKMILLR